MAVALIGTLDTKGRELDFARGVLHRAGVPTLVVDAGSLGPPAIEPDVSRDEVFRRAGSSAVAVKALGDRGEAVALAARGVAGLIKEMDDAGKVDGVLAIGGLERGRVIAHGARCGPCRSAGRRSWSARSPAARSRRSSAAPTS